MVAKQTVLGTGRSSEKSTVVRLIPDLRYTVKGKEEGCLPGAARALRS